MGAGYDIQASNSRSSSFTTPQTTSAGTVFNFSSPGASGDWYATSNDATSDTKSAAAAGKQGTSADIADDGTLTGSGNGGNNTLLIAGAIAAVGAMIALALILKR